jgi:hypothetical protein
MHTLTCTCITQTLFFTFNYLELNKLKIFKWKLIHFILPCKELLKQWRIVNNSDCLVCKEKENYKHFYFDCKYNKKYWQEVKKITTNLYIGDHVFNLESLVFDYKIYDQGYFDLNLLITLLMFENYHFQNCAYFWCFYSAETTMHCKVTCILYKKQAHFSQLFCLKVRSVTPWQLHDRKIRCLRGRWHS